MLRLSLLLTLSAVAFASCGGTVDLEKRSCPCSNGWTCCPLAAICVQDAASCPAPPTTYCKPPWQPTTAWCVLDVEVHDEDVCSRPDAPIVQVDLDGNRDECAKQHDLGQTYRPFDCTVGFGRTTVEGMLVDYGAQVVLPGPDRCRLRSPLLTTEPPR